MSRHTVSFPVRETTHRPAATQCNPYVVNTNVSPFFTAAPEQEAMVATTNQETIFFAIPWKKPTSEVLKPKFLADISLLCSQATVTNASIINDVDIIHLLTTCIRCIDASTDRIATNAADYARMDANQLSNVTAKIHLKTVANEQRYSITFGVNPPLLVPFAVVLPAGHRVQVGKGIWSWLCAAPNTGHADPEPPIIYVPKDCLNNKRPLLRSDKYILADDAVKELMAASALALATKAAIGHAEAGADLVVPHLPAISLPGNALPKGKVSFVGEGAAGGHNKQRNPFDADVHQPLSPPASPHPPTQNGYGKFAAFFLDPEKHKELIGYLFIQST
jgi:hypothetical protein